MATKKSAPKAAEKAPIVESSWQGNPAMDPNKSPQEKADALSEQIEEMHRNQTPDYPLPKAT